MPAGGKCTRSPVMPSPQLMLHTGVGCFLLAVFLGAGLHISNTRDNERKLGLARTSNPIGE